MNLFDPSRPTRAGKPLLLSGGFAPTLYLVPLAPARYRLMVFLNTHSNSYKDFHADVSLDQLKEFLFQWEVDPEATCFDWFGWRGPQDPTPPAARRLPTLSDLGLGKPKGSKT